MRVYDPPGRKNLKLNRLPSVRRFNEDTESMCSRVSRRSRSVATKEKQVKDLALPQPVEAKVAQPVEAKVVEDENYQLPVEV